MGAVSHPVNPVWSFLGALWESVLAQLIGPIFRRRNLGPVGALPDPDKALPLLFGLMSWQPPFFSLRMIVELHRKVSSLIEFLKQKWALQEVRVVSFHK